MSDLSLNLSAITRPGPRPQPLHFEVVRELRVEDLPLLQMPRNTVPYQVKRMTERHHALARAVASGMKPSEATAMLGYTMGAWVILSKSPAFMELLEFYRTNKDAEFAEMFGRMAGLGKDAVLELQRRLENEPEAFSAPFLLDVIAKTADRTGFAPSANQNVNINVNLGDRLAAARERARIAALGNMKDITPDDA